MAALEAHIVVELCESRQAVQTPMGVQGIKNKRSRSHLRGPGRNGRSPKRPRGKDLEQPKTFHPQVFDHIKGIYLGQLLCGCGQIPARRRCGATSAVQRDLKRSAAEALNEGSSRSTCSSEWLAARAGFCLVALIVALLLHHLVVEADDEPRRYPLGDKVPPFPTAS